MKKEFLTTGQVAKYCEVNYRTVCKWINTGKIEAFGTPGGHNRVKKKVFLNFCKKYNIPIPRELSTSSTNKIKKKILIVDDDKQMVKSMKGMLLLENRYDVEVAFDGFSAGKKFSEFKPDLVTLDIKMPKMDGFEVCEQIRKDPNNDEVKIMIISGYLKKEDIKKAHSLGADGCISKLINMNKLIKTIHEQINN
ncbi:MAG: response regulator [Candidatus Omnitrophica bacterium]|nr:response regulator [Candidatus Omnitrophota bacterium]